MALVINMWGAPGSGKSTGAAYVFSRLKAEGRNVELVAEFAKDKTWEKNRVAINNQAHIFGEQYHRMYRIQDQVDIIVTDSPLPLSIVYNTNPVLNVHFENMIWEVFESYENVNFLLFRNDYVDAGRWQDREQAESKYKQIRSLLEQHEFDYDILEGTTESYEEIAQAVLEMTK